MGTMDRRDRGRTRKKGRESQNDIKKLRRENEQLRREIWSLRDEYDKLEEILKKQKNREESDEPEDRSENEAAGSDYSEYDEEEEEDDEEDDDDSDSAEETNEEHDQEERLENAENQKISSEKMSNGGSPIQQQHRTRVNFDDLSVVDEEEELKKEKDKKDSIPSEQSASRVDEPLEKQQRSTFPYHTTSFEQGDPLTTTSFAYQSDCPFVFPTMAEASVYSNIAQSSMDESCRPMTTCSSHQTANPSRDISSHNYSRQVALVASSAPPPPGWQNSVLATAPISVPNFPRTQSPIAVCDSSKDLPPKPAELVESGPANVSGLAERRKAFVKQHSDNFRVIGPRDSSAGHNQATSASLDSSNKALRNYSEENHQLIREISILRDVYDELEIFKRWNKGAECAKPEENRQPRHFFAPLLAKPRCNGDDRQSDSPAGSEKTVSTVISTSRYNCEKGSADICVNGAVPLHGHIESGDAKAFFSSENLLIVSDARNNGSSNPMVKSVSCQDLSSWLSFNENVKSLNNDNHAKSDNTLDSMSTSSRAYKSQLNVTLRQPGSRKSTNSDTPEIPQLPSTGKLFNHPFLQSFEQAYQNFPVRTEGSSPARLMQSPLTIKVCESPVPATSYSSPVRVQSSFSNPSAVLEPDCGACSRKDLERLRLMIPPTRNGDKQEYHVTSFETPSPHTMKIPPMTPYELEALRRMPTGTSLVQQTPRLYQNVPFVPMAANGVQCCSANGHCDMVTKVPAQTQTSLEDETKAAAVSAESNQPTDQPKKRRSRKDKSGSVKEKRSSQRRRETLKKQSSASSKEPPESPGILSTRSHQDEKNESRSSSSGQESPKKDQTKRVSLYLSTKKRPSVSSTRTSRSRSVENARERHLTRGEAAALEGNATNSERERTNSISSREAAVREKTRKSSTSSGSVPWCACWGNGCI
ncbi:uncharacterized protein LOC100680254 isoform X2 [Nasonia vitripennis]|uniref:Uncharacterized protein n=1 Tax=Nasonia vitripennis TaxID=7425 RepID=A0A7M7Q211_NASVI|nr:uncharacterized protein LOC100680254 isoform X2 [Nasonia vitripennis]